MYSSAQNLDEALSFETENSAKVLTTEAIVGAKKFAAGLGKHGKFNVNQITEKEVRWDRIIIDIKTDILSSVGMAKRVGGNEEENEGEW